MNLSEHFELEEFDQDAPIPEDCIPILTRLCKEILEPVRALVLAPMTITSGYRPPEANAVAHGQPDSQHIYSPTHAAADFSLPVGAASPRAVFDRMRLDPTLPYRQLILEHGALSIVIHVSIDSEAPGVRSVLEGSTHNATPYVKIDHVDFAPPTNRDDVQEASAT